jgi:hypothetical protein
MGVVALAAGALASTTVQGEVELRTQLTIWMYAAPIAVSIGLLAAWRKSRHMERSLLNDPARRFALCLLPNVLVAALITAALFRTPQVAYIPAVWLLSYGSGLLAAGTYSVRAVMVMGGLFVSAGALALLLAPAYQNYCLTLTFAGLHVAFGWWIYLRHGG